MSTPAPSVRALPDGRDLLDALAEAFPNVSGWVVATGYVEEVELRLIAAGADTRHSLRGRYVLAQLSGPVSGPFGVTLSRLEGGRVEVVAGILVRARSIGVNACCLTASGADAPVVRIEAAVGPAVAPDAATEASGRWAAQASAAAARAAAPELEEAVEEPERGDWVQHFAFGLCEVVGVKGDRLLIRDPARGGRVLEIDVERLVVHPPVERDGKRLFRLSRRG